MGVDQIFKFNAFGGTSNVGAACPEKSENPGESKGGFIPKYKREEKWGRRGGEKKNGTSMVKRGSIEISKIWSRMKEQGNGWLQ